MTSSCPSRQRDRSLVIHAGKDWNSGSKVRCSISVLENSSTSEHPTQKFKNQSIWWPVQMMFQSNWGQSKWLQSKWSTSLNDFSPNDLPVQMIFQSKWYQSKWLQSKWSPSPNDLPVQMISVQMTPVQLIPVQLIPVWMTVDPSQPHVGVFSSPKWPFLQRSLELETMHHFHPPLSKEKGVFCNSLFIIKAIFRFQNQPLLEVLEETSYFTQSKSK